ncbi:hypothetical protein NE865_08099 [Phthorimaea operculella]|nr:hypothetical protein NE865_08099 [Phthorimaea operculella]
MNLGPIAPQEVVWYPYYLKDTGLSFISNRTAVACIAVISLISCFVDKVTLRDDVYFCRHPITEHILSVRCWLLSLFQMVNVLLLMATIVENSTLVDIYLRYSLAFVLIGLAVSLVSFLVRFKLQGMKKAAMEVVPEVAFLFVLFRCLPIVNRYGRELKEVY